MRPPSSWMLPTQVKFPDTHIITSFYSENLCFRKNTDTDASDVAAAAESFAYQHNTHHLPACITKWVKAVGLSLKTSWKL